MPAVRKRRAVFFSSEYVKPEGFDILLPKGSKTLEKVERQIKRQKSEKLAMEKQAAREAKIAEEQAQFHVREKKLAQVLQGRTMVFRGSSISWYTVKGVGNTVQAYYQQNRRSKPKLVKNFPLFVEIVTRALSEAKL